MKSALRSRGSTCLSAIPNNTFIVGQVWMTASLSSGCRLRLPADVASQVIEASY